MDSTAGANIDASSLPMMITADQNSMMERGSFETDGNAISTGKNSPQLRKIHLKVVTGAQEGATGPRRKPVGGELTKSMEEMSLAIVTGGKNIEKYLFPKDNENLKKQL